MRRRIAAGVLAAVLAVMATSATQARASNDVSGEDDQNAAFNVSGSVPGADKSGSETGRSGGQLADCADVSSVYPDGVEIPSDIAEAGLGSVVSFFNDHNPGGEQLSADDFAVVACVSDGAERRVPVFRKRQESAAAAARELWAGMELGSVTVGHTPLRGPVIVRMPQWFWVEEALPGADPDEVERALGPWTVSRDGITITAKVSDVVFDWGDGTGKSTCRPHGHPSLDREYTNEDPLAARWEAPECGHAFAEQGAGKRVLATARWVADWHGWGQSGQMSDEVRVEVVFDVAEIQAVIVR